MEATVPWHAGSSNNQGSSGSDLRTKPPQLTALRQNQWQIKTFASRISSITLKQLKPSPRWNISGTIGARDWIAGPVKLSSLKNRGYPMTNIMTIVVFLPRLLTWMILRHAWFYSSCYLFDSPTAMQRWGYGPLGLILLTLRLYYSVHGKWQHPLRESNRQGSLEGCPFLNPGVMF